MLKYVIVGNGVAGITAALEIRRREARAEIAVISGESDFFFSRTALMYAYMNQMSRRDLEPFERSVWKKQRIELIRGWVRDLNANSQSLRLDTGAEIPYDRLLLATGATPNRIPWPGMDRARQGLVNFVSLQDLERCERLTRPGGRAVIVGGGLIGVELAECLVHHRMEVTFLVREPWYWPMALGEAEGRMVSEHIRGHGVNLMHGELVQEVLVDNDGRVAGVATESGRRLECEMFGVTAGVRPAVEWLRKVETPPEIGRGVVTGPDFRTSLKNVWAAGDVAEIRRPGEQPRIEQIWYSAKRQGELAGRSMLGDAVDYQPPLYYNSSKFFELEYTTVGKVVDFPAEEGTLKSGPPMGARSFHAKLPGREVVIRVVERKGAVTGFNMLGSRWNHSVLERWIHERRSLDYVIGRLHEAQFDVEFGREKLGPVRAEYEQWKAASPGTAPVETLQEV